MNATRITRFARVFAMVVFVGVALAMSTGVAHAASGPVDSNPGEFLIGGFLEAVVFAVVFFFIGGAILVFRRTKLVFRRR